MKKKLSNKLTVKLAHLSDDQVEQLIARAKAMKRRSSSDDSLDKWIERVMLKDKRSLERADKRLTGVAVAVTAKSAFVETSEGTRLVRLLGQRVVVGDEVTIVITSETEAAVLEISPRRTKLSRPDVGRSDREQVIVANVDVVVIVVSVVAPPLHPRLIDRYLVAIQQGLATPMIYVNKLDLLEDETELSVLDPYRGIGIPVILGSTVTPGGGDELRAALVGKVCAFVGHSGVGKSSIVNYLKPDADLDIGSVMKGYGRGMHTTTASSLHRLADGTVLIDTPGIRSFGLRALESSQIDSYFQEFSGHQCKFRDCTHIHEPGCGVLAAIESGEIEKVRYDAYRRLREELS